MSLFFMLWQFTLLDKYAFLNNIPPTKILKLLQSSVDCRVTHICIISDVAVMARMHMSRGYNKISNRSLSLVLSLFLYLMQGKNGSKQKFPHSQFDSSFKHMQLS